MVMVKFFATLQEPVGENKVEIDAKDVSSLLDIILERYPGLKPELLDDEGELKDTIKFMLNGRNVDFLDGMETKLKKDDTVAVFPLVAGG